MSRNENRWRAAARAAAYDYPQLRRALEDLRSQSVTPQLSGMPGGGGPRRKTEDTALLELPFGQMRRLEAVEQAVAISAQLTSGPSRVKLIELVYFTRRFTVGGAALQIPISDRQAWAWNNDFLLLVWARLRQN